MSNIVEFVLKMTDLMSKPFDNITQKSQKTQKTLDEVKKSSKNLGSQFKRTGNTIDSLRQTVDKLNRRKALLPAGSVSQIKDINKEITRLNKQINHLDGLGNGGSRIGGLMNKLPMGRLLSNPLVWAGMAATKAVGGVVNMTSAGKQERITRQVDESKLRKVMANTMGSEEGDFQSVLNLVKSQQKGGVVARDVQVAGSQELGTYLTESKSLKQLIPVMNDMLAQQYGINASQEQAVNIGSMLGKVMDGQTGALSRYGYKFDETQEKILKTGTEAQRVATLFDVVNASVGGMNTALGNTPEGKLKKLQNEALDLRVRMGAIAMDISGVWGKVVAARDSVFGKMLDFFEAHKEGILSIVNGIATGISVTFNAMATAIGWVVNSFINLWTWIQNNRTGLLALLASVTTGFAVYKAWQAWQVITHLWLMRSSIAQMLLAKKTMFTTAMTNLYTTSLKLLRIAFLSTPIGWIVAGLGLVVGAVVYAWNKFEGFRTFLFGLWESIKKIFSNIGKIIGNVFAPLSSGIAALMEGRFLDAGREFLKLNFISMGASFVSQIRGGALTEGVGDAYHKGKSDRATYERHQRYVKARDAQIAKNNEAKQKAMMNAAFAPTGGGGTGGGAGAGAGEGGAGAVGKGITQSGPKVITINMNKELIGSMAINSYNIKEGMGEMEDRVKELFYRLFYSLETQNG